MPTANRFYAAVAVSLEVFSNWVAKNNGSFVYPRSRTIALVHGKRYIYVAANALAPNWGPQLCRSGIPGQQRHAGLPVGRDGPHRLPVVSGIGNVAHA